MQVWPHQITSYSASEVQEHCVRDAAWQSFRLSLKGIPTDKKLDKLDHYLSHCILGGYLRPYRVVQIQVSNYINALKRGGQLNMQCEVVR